MYISDSLHKTKFWSYLPPATKLGQGYIFRRVCKEFCSWGGWYPSMHCRSPGPPQGGELRGLAWGVSRPTPRGEVEESGLGGLQVYTQGVLMHTPRGYPSIHWSRHPPEDSYCCRQYASYWNAFLFQDYFACNFRAMNQNRIDGLVSQPK